MDAKTPSYAETGRRFGEERHVRPCTDRDGVGYALRAIYDDVAQSRAIPEDFRRLLQQLG